MFKIFPYEYYQKHILQFTDISFKEAFKKMLLSFFLLEPYQLLLNEPVSLSLKKYLKLEYDRYRLLKGYPLEYLLGKKEFLSMNFFVKKGVLIPRIETEKLVQMLINDAKDGERVLDIGCGSGNIAVSLKKLNPNLEVEAIDISRVAVRIAKKNRDRLSAGSLPIYRKSIKDFYTESKYQIIVSNPPYISGEEKKMMGLDTLKYEPSIALFADKNGFSFFHLIKEKLKDVLSIGGSIYLECGFNQAQGVSDIFLPFFEEIFIEKDIFEKERYVVGKKYRGE